MRTKHISKTLSANDTGDTGGHQAGILVPKVENILGFFPSLGRLEENPRCLLMFVDSSGKFWEFSFIYYNNAVRGGTRNEYRLTRMTQYIRSNSLRPGDQLNLSRDDYDRYLVSFTRAKPAARSQGSVLKLGSGWRVVQF